MSKCWEPLVKRKSIFYVLITARAIKIFKTLAEKDDR